MAVVTGGGGGIGAAIAEELGRRGVLVVTMDPLVSLDGVEPLPAPEETTAGRIVAAGGAARASSVSVTDADAVRALFEELVAEHGRVDAVVNVAGISRPTSFATGREEDWRAVLEVHLDGYRNVLAAALPLMASAGQGRVLGVTSGSGWRAADAGAYGCAKRAVAALTWQVGRVAPPGVAVNAVSPIAVTRMVTAALERAGAGAGGGARGGAGGATGGLSLGAMPQPADLGPLGAHLVGDTIGWCRGRVLFAGGSEVAVVDEPRLLEVVRTDTAPSLPHLLEAVTGALVRAEAEQATSGGGNPRFPSAFDAAGGDLPAPAVRACALVTDQRGVASALTAALEARGLAVCPVEPGSGPGFDDAAGALAATVERHGPVDGVVVALAGPPPGPGTAPPWERVLAEHAGITEDLRRDAGWARAVVEQAAAGGRPIRLVTVTDAATAGGRSRAQAAAQLARAARRATEDRVAAFAVGSEGPEPQELAALAVHLLCSPDAAGLAGAELAAGPGWVGLRSHPRVGASVVLGRPEVPAWFDAALQEIIGTAGPPGGEEE